MENTGVEESKPIAETIAKLPVQVGTALVDGTETVLADGEHVMAKVGTAVVDVARTVVVGTVEVTQRIGRDVEQAVAPLDPASKPAPPAGPIPVAA